VTEDRRPFGLPAVAREIGIVAVIGPAGGVLAWALLDLAAYRARLGFCVTLGLAIAGTWRVLVAVRAEPDAPEVSPVEPEPEPVDFADLSSLEYRLSWGSVDRERYESRLRPLLGRLADERLRHRHGVDRARQPDRARQIVGEQLWQLMTAPPARGAPPPTPRQLAEIVSRIEAI
jgi:hypothetical protein